MSSGSKRLVLIAHDAGSANAVFGYAMSAEAGGNRIDAYGRGPAEEIFRREIPDWFRGGDPEFRAGDFVVTGLSGIHSRFELDQVKLARAAGAARIISILDIPYNIDIRFQHDGSFLDPSHFPDEIWIAKLDEKTASPEIRRRLVVRSNPYWDYVRRTRYGSPPAITDEFVRAHEGRYILYLTDYLSEQYGESLGFDEFSLLRDFLGAHAEVCPETPVLFRHHPAEKPGKYDAILATQPGLRFAISASPLPEAIWYSKLVCGSLSSVFYESTLIRKPSLSLQFGAKEVRKRAPDGVSYLTTKAELVEALRGSAD